MADRAPHFLHDYAVAGIERVRLEDWVRQVGWERLCNRAGTTFRKLPETETRNISEAKALDLIVARPSMIKRPVLTIGIGRAQQILVGFSPRGLHGRAARHALSGRSARRGDTAPAVCRTGA